MSFPANAPGAHASAQTSHRIVSRSDKAVAVLMTNRPFANDFRTMFGEGRIQTERAAGLVALVNAYLTGRAGENSGKPETQTRW